MCADSESIIYSLTPSGSIFTIFDNSTFELF